MTLTTLTLEDGSPLAVHDDMEIRCDVHDIRTTWGALDGVQQLAVQEGLDTVADLPCLLAPYSKGTLRAMWAAFPSRLGDYEDRANRVHRALEELGAAARAQPAQIPSDFSKEPWNL